MNRTKERVMNGTDLNIVIPGYEDIKGDELLYASFNSPVSSSTLPPISKKYQKTDLGTNESSLPVFANQNDIDQQYTTTKMLLEYIEALNHKAIYAENGSNYPPHEPSFFEDVYQATIDELKLNNK